MKFVKITQNISESVVEMGEDLRVDALKATKDAQDPGYSAAITSMENNQKKMAEIMIEKAKEAGEALHIDDSYNTSDIDSLLKTAGVNEALLKEGFEPSIDNNSVILKLATRKNLEKLVECLRFSGVRYVVERISEDINNYKVTFLPKATLTEAKYVPVTDDDFIVIDENVSEELSEETKQVSGLINVNGASHAQVGDSVNGKVIAEIKPTENEKFAAINALNERHPVWFDVIYDDDSVDVVARKDERTIDEEVEKPVSDSDDFEFRDLWDQVYFSLVDSGNEEIINAVGGRGKYDVYEVNNAGTKDDKQVLVITNSDHDFGKQVANFFDLTFDEDGTDLYIYIPQSEVFKPEEPSVEPAEASEENAEESEEEIEIEEEEPITDAEIEAEVEPEMEEPVEDESGEQEDDIEPVWEDEDDESVIMGDPMFGDIEDDEDVWEED